MRVGFIGLGTMGGSMALNAQKGGHDMVVHDLRREVAAPHLKAGAAWAERDSRVPMLLQEERAGVDIKVPADKIQEVLKRDG